MSPLVIWQTQPVANRTWTSPEARAELYRTVSYKGSGCGRALRVSMPLRFCRHNRVQKSTSTARTQIIITGHHPTHLTLAQIVPLLFQSFLLPHSFSFDPFPLSTLIPRTLLRQHSRCRFHPLFLGHCPPIDAWESILGCLVPRLAVKVLLHPIR